MIRVTDLSSYIFCRRKLFLEKVLGFFEIKKEAVLLGKIRHEAFEKTSDAEEKVIKKIKSIEEVDEAYRKEYSKILKNVVKKNKKGIESFGFDLSKVFEENWEILLNEIGERAKTVRTVISEKNVFGEKLWEMLVPKIISEYRIESEKLGLVGVIDQIRNFEESLVPIEIKTGKCPQEGVWENHKIQLAAYILLLEETQAWPGKTSKKVDKGIVKYVDHDAERPIVMNPFLKEEVIRLISEVNKLLSAKEAPEIEQSEKCRHCGLADKCRNQGLIKYKLQELKN